MVSPVYPTYLIPTFDPQLLPSQLDSGLFFLKAEYLTPTNKLIMTINNGNAADWIYTEEERAFFTEESHILKDMHAALCFNTKRKQKLTAKRQRLKEMIEEKKAWRQWAVAQYGAINSLLQQNHVRHKVLKTQWVLHQRLALYTNRAIVQIANNHLPSLTQHFQDIQKILDSEYYWRKPPAYVNAYWQYLVEFQQCASTLQDILCESMLARLIALDESRFRENSPVAAMAVQLREKEGGSSCTVISASPHRMFSGSSDKLSADHFIYYHQYIEQHGSAIAKERLLQLSWFKKQSDNSPLPMITTVNHFLVPAELADQVPGTRLWPGWLFQGNNVRYNLFEKSMYLFAYLNKHRSVEHCFVDYELPETYEYLLDEFRGKETEIDNVVKMIESYQEQFSSIFATLFYGDTKKCLSNYRMLLARCQKTIFHDKLSLFENLIGGYFEKSINATESLKPVVTNSEQLQIYWEDLQKKYTECLNSISPHQNIPERMQILQQKMTQLIAFTKARELFTALADGGLINVHEVRFLIDYDGNLKERCSPLAAAFTRFNEPLVLLLSQQLSQEFKSYASVASDEQQLNLQRDRIRGLHALIRHFGTTNMKQAVEKRFKKYFLNHLQEMLLDDVDSAASDTNYLRTAEMIKHLGQYYRCGNKTISEYIDELDEMKKQNQSFWKARCISLVIVLALEYAQHRFNKELPEFERRLFDLLQSDRSCGYNNNTMKFIKDICHALVNQESNLDVCYAHLSKAEQVLLGNNLETNTSVFELIASVAQLHKTQAVINDITRDPVATLQQIKTVSKNISTLLQQNPLTQSRDDIQLVASGKRARFSKQYINEEILQNIKCRFG